MVITFSPRRAPQGLVCQHRQTGVDAGGGGGYKRGPFGLRTGGDCCLRLWRRGKGCADGGHTGMMLGGRHDVRAGCERLEALVWVYL
jgi:hypothetical protein